MQGQGQGAGLTENQSSLAGLLWGSVLTTLCASII